MVKANIKTPRSRRHARIRKKIAGTTERPRLAVFRSLNHIYAAVIDDANDTTLLSASTMEKTVQQEIKGKNKSAKAGIVGALVAKRALEKGIAQVVFDRAGYRYHGRVKALAEAARQGGLKF
jgi:large subunit ribosomal protein L18